MNMTSPLPLPLPLPRPRRTGIAIAGWLALTFSSPAQSSPAATQEKEPDPPAAPASAWTFNADAGYAHQFDASLDEGGGFEVNRFAVRAGARYQLEPRRSIGLSLGYDRHHYHFSGRSGFGGADPWDAVNTIRVSAPVQWEFNDRWTGFVLPSLRWNAEEGADWTESMLGGGFAGVSYRFNDNLTLGPGLGVLTQIEDSPSYFPVLLIRWNVIGKWWVATDQGLGASQGPGLSLTYAASDQWSAFLGGRYEKFRFRLSESGPNADGVGEERGVPIYAGATYRWQRERSVSLIGGVKLGGDLTLDNSSGHEVADTDYDPAPFVGVSCDFKF